MLHRAGAQVRRCFPGPLRSRDQIGRGPMSGSWRCLWRRTTTAPAVQGRGLAQGLQLCRMPQRRLVTVPVASGIRRSGEDWIVPDTVQTFVRGLDVIDRKLLARRLHLDPDILEQVGRSGRTALTPQSCLLLEDVLLARLLAEDDVDTFELACRFLTSMKPPSKEVLDWIEEDHRNHTAPLADAVCRLCTSGQSVERPVLRRLDALRAWMHQHQQQQRWRHISALVLNRLVAMGLAARASLPIPDARAHARLQRQAIQARHLIPRLLESMDPGITEHNTSDYLVRQALDGLLVMGGWGTRAGDLLRDWYRDWLTLEPACPRITAPGEPLTDSMAFRDWVPSSYGGSLPALEMGLAGSGLQGSIAQPPRLPGPSPSSDRVNMTIWLGSARMGGRQVGLALDLKLRPWQAKLVHLFRRLRQAVRSDPDADTPDEAPRPARQVLVFGGLCWNDLDPLPSQIVQAAGLSPASSLHLSDKAIQRLQWAFCHCLYNTIGQHHGVLISQVPYVAAHDKRCAVSGMTSITSVEELIRRLLQPPDGWQPLPIVIMQDEPVRAALRAPEALVLDSLTLAYLARQFLISVDPDLFRHDGGQESGGADM